MGRQRNPPRQRVDNMITDAYTRNRPQSDAYYDNVTGRMPGATQRADQLWNTIYDQASSAGGANYNPNDFESYGIFRGMTGPNGGIDQGRISSIDENIGGFKEIGRTGGWSESDIAGSKLQSSRVPTSIFAGMKQREDQRRNITGGYAPGGGTSSARMGRESARAAADSVLDSDLSRNADIRQGKLQGLSGANSAEMGLLDLITGMQRTGASGMQSGEGMALDATQRENLAGTQALSNLYNSSPGELDSLLGHELSGRSLDMSAINSLIGQQGNEDVRRWDRKGKVSNAAGGAAGTAFGGPQTGQFMSKGKG